LREKLYKKWVYKIFMIEVKSKSRIRDKFILYFVVLSCLPVLLLGIVSLSAVSVSHRQSVNDLEYQVILEKSKNIKNFFDNIQSTLAIKVETLDAEALSKSNSLWQTSFAEALLKENTSFLEVSFADLQGKEIVKKSKTNKNPDLLYITKSLQFQKAIRGEATISSVHTKISGQAVTIMVPVFVEGGVHNVVIAEVDLSPINKLMKGTVLGSSGYILLLDESGTVVAGESIGSFAPGYNLSNWERVSRTLVIGGRYHSPVKNVPVVGSGMSISNINWSIFVEWPISDADNLINEIRNKILFAVFLSIIVVLLLAPIISSRLVYPIRLLEKTSREIEKGDFEQKVEIKTGDELQELGESFNRMAVGLKRLQELKNEFVFIAAHELRAPVTAIKGYLSLLLEGDAGELPKRVRDFISPVKQSNDRLVTLVSDLLDVARSEAGQLGISVVASDIKAQINSIIKEVQPLLMEKYIILTYEPEPDLPLVFVDETRFKEVIMNLVSNSIKYGSNNGWIKITHVVKNDIVETIVADNGRGISEEDQKHLFQKFFRADDVKKTPIQGTGLGLFITKELVEKMGGTITVKSSLGKGAAFTVAFRRG